MAVLKIKMTIKVEQSQSASGSGEAASGSGGAASTLPVPPVPFAPLPEPSPGEPVPFAPLPEPSPEEWGGLHVPFLPADQPREYVPAKAKSVPAVAKSMPRNHPVPAVAKYGLAAARPVSLPHADMAGSVAKSMPGERVGCLVVSVRLPPADV